MRILRTKMITKIIVFALIIYACISLITLQGRVETAQGDLQVVKRAVADMEISNAQLEYEIANYNESDVIAGIARSELGLVLPGEIVFYDAGSIHDKTD